MSRKDSQDKNRDEKTLEPDEVLEPAGADGGAAGETSGLQTERDDLLARLQRLSADFANYQKRVKRDVESAQTFANEELIRALLHVLDDMERALEAGRENHPVDDPLLVGMQLVHDKLAETLAKFGCKGIDAVGQAFDPEKHSAMMQEPSDEHEPMTVLRELQRGYELNGRTLRPSAVVVSKAPGEDAD